MPSAPVPSPKRKCPRTLAPSLPKTCGVQFILWCATSHNCMTTSVPAAPPAASASRRIARRLLPFLFILFVIAFLDRVNVSYAALEMTRDLSFSDSVFGLGSGIFFLGYFLLEIPGCLIVERWSARKWISRIMVSWGITSMVMAFIRTPGQFYTVRIVLGAAEAGFFPGIIVYF